MTERSESSKPTSPSAPRTIRLAENTVHHESGVDYWDGYRVTVGWSEEDDAWIARISGTAAGECIADGVSKETALLALACSIAASMDAL